jgi:hypothetical protein
MEQPNPWRRVRRPRPRLVWLLWPVIIYVALVLATELNPQSVIAVLLAIPVACGVLALGLIGLHHVVALGAERWWPPVDVPPPPPDESDAQGVTPYMQPPMIVYPALAQARGQCGWLKLRVRVDREGRIRHFQVVEQAPGHVFKRAVAAALFKARLPPDPDATPLREMVSVISFVAPSKNPPEWAKQKLAEADQPGWRVGVRRPVGPGDPAL